MTASVAMTCCEPSRRGEAQALAAELGLDLREALPGEGSDLVLVMTAKRLELRACGRPAPGPVFVDFTSLVDGGRAQGGRIGDEALARAAGVRGEPRPTVIDATAGLGRDSFVLATLGCRVIACERNPIVAALLADGLRRWNEERGAAALHGEIRLHAGNAVALLGATGADVVLVDPMHPPRHKSAAVKKEMRLLQRLVGTDEDQPDLLVAAIAAARQRVVVKRPRHAPPIPGPEPVGRIAGRSTRFDIYCGLAGR